MNNVTPSSDIGPFIQLKVNSLITAVVEKILTDTDYMLNFRGQTFTFKSRVPLYTGQNLLLRVKHGPNDSKEFELVHSSKPEIKEPIFKPVELKKILSELNLPTDKNHLAILSEFLKAKAPIEREILIKTNTVAKDETHIKAAAFLTSNDIDITEETVNTFSRVYQQGAEEKFQAYSDSARITKAIAFFLKRIEVGADKITSDAIHKSIKSALSAGPAPSEITELIKEIINNDPILQKMEELLKEIESNTEARTHQETINTAVINELSVLIKKLTASEINEKPIKELLKNNRDISHSARAMIIEEALNIIKNSIKQLSKNETELVDKYSAFTAMNNLFTIKGEKALVVEVPIRLGEKTEIIRIQINPDEKKEQSGERGIGMMIGVNMSKLGRVTARAYLQSRKVNITFNVVNNEIKKLFEQNLNDLDKSLQKEGFETSIKINTRKIEDETGPSYYQIDFTA